MMQERLGDSIQVVVTVVGLATEQALDEVRLMGLVIGGSKCFEQPDQVG